MKANSVLKVRAGPSGVHIFNRDTGANILLDESVPPKKSWAKAPRQVSIALTNACDLACAHCYAQKSRAVLDFDLIADSISELDAYGCLSVGFGGGEPTLFPRLVELCDFVTKSTSLGVTMTTHGQGLRPELVSELADSMHFIRISMDGVGRTYRSVRGRSFANLVAKIRDVSKVLPFGINFVVNEKTIGDLDAAVGLAEELGAAEFLLLPEQAGGRASGVDAQTLRLLQSWVWRYRGGVRLSISEASADGFPISNPLAAETGLGAFAHIDASGVLKANSFTGQGVRIRGDGLMKALGRLKEGRVE